MRERRALLAVVSAACAYLPDGASAGDPAPVIQTGLPASTVPVFKETGAPNFSYPDGSTSTGAAGGSADGGSGGVSTVNYTSCPGCNPLQTMLAQSWGASASEAATTIGIAPDALAATCVVESNCQSVNGAGTVSGAFQMTNATYMQMMQEVQANNPSLSLDTSLAGKMDPANQAYAASQYIYDGAVALQDNGIANPTNLDVRGYYQFGPGAATSLANAPDSANLESIVNLSPSAMANNGITSTTTVGQWRQGVVNKLGASASSQVLS